jgi:cell division septation protein DedD
MSEYQDTEITLGTGRLLTMFFGLVLVCGIFFGLGFTMGRSAAAAGGPVTVTPAATAAVMPTTHSGAKPGAAHDTAASCTEGQSCAPAVSSAEAAAPAAAPVETAARSSATRQPELTRDAGGVPTGIVVQIAAVSKKEDAETLLGALRKKDYPVFVAPDSGDHLFHVQIGPFANKQEAQTMKDKLAGDGYNAIVK